MKTHFSAIILRIILPSFITILSLSVASCKKEQIKETPKTPITLEIKEVTATTVTFEGHIEVDENLIEQSKVTVEFYSDSNIYDKIHEETHVDENGDYIIFIDFVEFGTTFHCTATLDTGEKTVSTEVTDFTTNSLSIEVSATATSASAHITGSLKGYSEKDAANITAGLLWGDNKDEVEAGNGTKETIQIAGDGSFDLDLADLTYLTEYYIRPFFVFNSESFYSEIYQFSTEDAYRHNVDLTVATDLSSSETANCYIISKDGIYKIKAVKGNGNESVGEVASCKVLWETFGTLEDIHPGDLVPNISYENGYIGFEASDRHGNALIAATDTEGNVLWSWHLWFTEEPQGQVYYNDAGTMMDRNLGATSATPGKVETLGLTYQWGRKDPFVGVASISYFKTPVKATADVYYYEACDQTTGTIEYATAHPATFIINEQIPYDWIYREEGSTADNTLWQSSKTIFDPCPAGWRVPDGGENGVWAKASGNTGLITTKFSSSVEGIYFTGIFGDDVIFYPAHGFRDRRDGRHVNTGSLSSWWSVTSTGDYPYMAYGFFQYGEFYTAYNKNTRATRASGWSVRCFKITSK